MSNYDIILMAGIGILLITVIVFHLHYRSSVKDKNRGIVQLISEQTRLARELESALIEKETLEKIVKHRLNNTDSPHRAGHTDCKSARAGTGNH